MSLMLAATEAKVELASKIQNRIAAGAPVWAVAKDEVPAWFAAAVEGEAVEAVFQSNHATVAVLEDGRAVVRRAPRG